MWWRIKTSWNFMSRHSQCVPVPPASLPAVAWASLPTPYSMAIKVWFAHTTCPSRHSGGPGSTPAGSDQKTDDVKVVPQKNETPIPCFVGVSRISGRESLKKTQHAILKSYNKKKRVRVNAWPEQGCSAGAAANCRGEFRNPAKEYS